MASPQDLDVSEHEASASTVAWVTPHKATYLKPLIEAFSNAQPASWKTCIIWPEEHQSEHPQELVTPCAPNLEIRPVRTRHTSLPDANSLVPNRKPPVRKRYLPTNEIWQTLRDLRPRAMVVHEYSPFTVAGLLFAKWSGIPVVTLTDVGQRNQQIFKPTVRLWHAWWSLFIKGAIAGCPDAHVPISGRSIPSISAYHAVDSRLYQPPARLTSSSDTVVFVYVGQLIPRKGLDLWMKAAAELKRRGKSHFRLRIIGGGDDSWLKQHVADQHMEQEIEWCGFLSGDQLRAAMGEGDVFVLPSREDTYAAVVHEAACLGLPLLVSKHAGAAEGVVREGLNGYVIEPTDIAGFADRMEHLLNADLRARMGAAAREVGDEISAHRRGTALWNWMQDLCHLHQG